MLQKLLREPIIASVVMKAIALVSSRYGLDITIDDLMYMSIGIDAVLGVVARSQVEPMAKRREREAAAIAADPDLTPVE
jgi:hypothetical protein